MANDKDVNMAGIVFFIILIGWLLIGAPSCSSSGGGDYGAFLESNY